MGWEWRHCIWPDVRPRVRKVPWIRAATPALAPDLAPTLTPALPFSPCSCSRSKASPKHKQRQRLHTSASASWSEGCDESIGCTCGAKEEGTIGDIKLWNSAVWGAGAEMGGSYMTRISPVVLGTLPRGKK